MKRFKIFLSLLVALFSFAGCATQGPWHGKVIDSETKAPIEGAVVVAVWHSFNMGLGDTVDRFYDANETMTDKDGNWEMPQYKTVFIPIGRSLKMPEFTIFKPGYGAFPYGQVSPRGIPGWEVFLKENAVVELPKLTDNNKRLSSLGMMSLVDVPSEKIPKYYDLVNIERKNLGLSTF